MKRITFILVAAVFCLSVPAAIVAQTNAMLGTWNLNLEKSKFPDGTKPQSLTRSVTADGDSVKYSYAGKGPDGAAITYSFTVKYDEKDYEVMGSGMPFGADHVSIKKLNAHAFKATLKKGGKVVATADATVSADGKVSTLVSKGTDAKGNPAESTAVYDKQ